MSQPRTGSKRRSFPTGGTSPSSSGATAPGSSATVAAAPTGVEMRKVAATARLVDGLATRAPDDELSSGLQAVEEMAPISMLRFATRAAVGAMALAIIFGGRELALIAIIGASALGGGLIRRWLACVSTNLFFPPLSAALMAGIAAAVTIALGLDGPQRLVAVCPCMVLVPGPHFLNGAIDLVRARIPLGIARRTYATLIVLAISVGLLMGLALGRVVLPVGIPPVTVPLAADIIAAGFAVAAYGSFFSMPWRTIPVPVGIGMLTHARRWCLLVEVQASAAGAALCACLVAGTLPSSRLAGFAYPLLPSLSLRSYRSFPASCSFAWLPALARLRFAESWPNQDCSRAHLRTARPRSLFCWP